MYIHNCVYIYSYVYIMCIYIYMYMFCAPPPSPPSLEDLSQRPVTDLATFFLFCLLNPHSSRAYYIRNDYTGKCSNAEARKRRGAPLLTSIPQFLDKPFFVCFVLFLNPHSQRANYIRNAHRSAVMR